MKKKLLTACLTGLLAVGIAGCSSNSNSSSSSSSAKTQTSKAQQQSSSEPTASSAAGSTSTIKGPKALKVRYENVRYTTRLDNEYQEERLYQRVPGLTTSNQIYHWDHLNVKAGQKVYVDKKAIATFKDQDDPNDYDHEDYYRITFNKNGGQKYWANDDVIEQEANDGYDD